MVSEMWYALKSFGAGELKPVSSNMVLSQKSLRTKIILRLFDYGLNQCLIFCHQAIQQQFYIYNFVISKCVILYSPPRLNEHHMRRLISLFDLSFLFVSKEC